jgi:hypothetical protein
VEKIARRGVPWFLLRAKYYSADETKEHDVLEEKCLEGVFFSKT